MQELRLDTNAIDYAIIAAYFVVVLGIGLVARLACSVHRAGHHRDPLPGLLLMAGDEHTGDSEQVDAEAQRRFADLFDLRRIIRGLFIVSGLVLFVLGIGASDEDIDQAASVSVNLWMGLALLVVGAIFIAWALARPVGRATAPTRGSAR